jgi:hypothetical protein
MTSTAPAPAVDRQAEDAPRRLIAAGIIARRPQGRTLRLAITAAGVTGSLRRAAAR